jgi:hypothetical protein
MSMKIYEALDRESRERVYAFRYEQLAQQGPIAGLSLDHNRKLIYDAADETATIYYVEENDVILGTLRVNFSQFGALPVTLRAHYQTQSLENVLDSDRVSVTSLLVLDPEVNRSRTVALLFASVYHACLERDLLANFWESDPQDSNLFCRLGYRSLEVATKLENGLQPLVLCVQDFEYLRRMESPLAWLVGRREGDGGETAFLLGTLYGGFLEATAHFLSKRLREIRKFEASQMDCAADLTSQCLYA